MVTGTLRTFAASITIVMSFFHGIAGRTVVVLGAGKLPVCRVGVLGQVVGADHKKIDPVLYKFLSGQAGSGYAEHHAELCIFVERHAALPQVLAAALHHRMAASQSSTFVTMGNITRSGPRAAARSKRADLRLELVGLAQTVADARRPSLEDCRP